MSKSRARTEADLAAEKDKADPAVWARPKPWVGVRSGGGQGSPQGRSGTKRLLQSSEAQNPFLESQFEHHPFLGIKDF